MDKDLILENLATAIVEGDDVIASTNAKAALEIQMDPMQAVEKGISKGMDSIGEQFESGDTRTLNGRQRIQSSHGSFRSRDRGTEERNCPTWYCSHRYCEG
jgi:hypothetical protein